MVSSLHLTASQLQSTMPLRIWICFIVVLPTQATCHVNITSSLMISISTFMMVLLLMVVGVGSSIWLVTPLGQTELQFSDRTPRNYRASTSTSTQYDCRLRAPFRAPSASNPSLWVLRTLMARTITKFALAPWPSAPSQARFDSDNFPVGINTQSSWCISFNKAPLKI